jgi:CRP-like cAMP-binding protein
MINTDALAGIRLFRGIEPSALGELLSCLGARVADYRKNDLMVEEGDAVDEFGVILSGHARSVKWDASGRVIILTLLERGGEFGVLVAAKQGSVSPVTIQAQDDVSVLFIPYRRLVTRCERSCGSHEALLQNYVGILADKGLELHERINCLLRPSAREKILVYLRRISCEQGSLAVELPLNRGEMASYLNIERSALSRELSAMQRDGLIAYRRNEFLLADER